MDLFYLAEINGWQHTRKSLESEKKRHDLIFEQLLFFAIGNHYKKGPDCFVLAGIFLLYKFSNKKQIFYYLGYMSSPFIENMFSFLIVSMVQLFIKRIIMEKVRIVELSRFLGIIAALFIALLSIQLLRIESPPLQVGSIIFSLL